MNSRRKKILLLGASFSTRNMGVWALASGAITSAFHEYPDAEVCLMDYHAESATYQVRHSRGSCTVPLINIRFSKKFWLANNIARLLVTALAIRMIPFRSFRNRVISRNACLRHIHESDIVGSIAGGDSFSDIYGIGRLIYVALPQILALLMAKPLALLPQTFGPFDSLTGKLVARYVLRRASMIFSRDREGLETVQDILAGVGVRPEFCHDLGFILEPHISHERIPRSLRVNDRIAPVIGLNVSGLLYMGGYSGNNMFRLKADYRRLVQDLITYFIREHDAHVILIPHVFGRDEKSESDAIACRGVYDECRKIVGSRLHVLVDEYDQYEVKSIIGSCDFFLGSRMHSCIAALSQCIPAVGLAYSRKFSGVFASIGMEEMVVDIRGHDEKSVVEAVDRLFRRQREFRKRLEATIPAVRASVLELFGQVLIDPGRRNNRRRGMVAIDETASVPVSRIHARKSSRNTQTELRFCAAG